MAVKHWTKNNNTTQLLYAPLKDFVQLCIHPLVPFSSSPIGPKPTHLWNALRQHDQKEGIASLGIDDKRAGNDKIQHSTTKGVHVPLQQLHKIITRGTTAIRARPRGRGCSGAWKSMLRIRSLPNLYPSVSPFRLDPCLANGHAPSTKHSVTCHSNIRGEPINPRTWTLQLMSRN